MKVLAERVDGSENATHSLRQRSQRAVDRDDVADDRDLAAAARDAHARRRDHETRPRSATCAAAKDRAAAAADRQAAVSDRKAAADDRCAAQKICQALLSQLAIAETDPLTGARTRAAGLVDLDREIDRAYRTRDRLVATYVDIVGLKQVNDTHGHFAGDALIAGVVGEIRAQLRPYDVIVRLGGDEFLCAMPGATTRIARERFHSVQAALVDHPDPGRIKCGFAELGHADRAVDLIGRADAALPISAPRKPDPPGVRAFR